MSANAAGKWTAFPVTVPHAERDDYSSSIWIVGAEGEGAVGARTGVGAAVGAGVGGAVGAGARATPKVS